MLPVLHAANYFSRQYEKQRRGETDTEPAVWQCARRSWRVITAGCCVFVARTNVNDSARAAGAVDGV